MELSQAFGKFFQEEPPVTPPVQKPEPVVKNAEPIKKTVQTPELRRDLGMRYLGSQPDLSQFYMINIQIERDDCHLICVFLLVLILSMLLTKK